MNANKTDAVKVLSKPALVPSSIMKSTPISYYIIFLTIYILAFVCIFEKNVQLIGYGLLYTINILASIFLVKDLHSKIANNVPIFVGIIIIIILNIVSSSLLIVSISRIYKYSKDDEKLVLSYNNINKIYLYRDLFISVLVFLWIILLYIFIEPNPSFNIDNVFDKNLKMGIIEFFKLIMFAYPLAMSPFLVYHANNLVNITTSLI
jgi:lysylphosphatidylglycerol synthetase-like protein (DUF2156 family)